MGKGITPRGLLQSRRRVLKVVLERLHLVKVSELMLVSFEQILINEVLVRFLGDYRKAAMNQQSVRANNFKQQNSN